MKLNAEQRKDYQKRLVQIKKDFEKLYNPKNERASIIDALAKKYNVGASSIRRIITKRKWGKRDGIAKNAAEHKKIMRELNRQRKEKEKQETLDSLKKEFKVLHDANLKDLKKITSFLKHRKNDN